MGKDNLEELENLLDACPCLTWLKDEKGRIVYTNQFYRDISQYTKAEIIGKEDIEIWGVTLKSGINYCPVQKIYLNLHEENLYKENKVIGKKGIAKDVTLDIAFVKQFENIYSYIIESFKEPSYEEYVKILNKFQEVGNKLFEDSDEAYVMVTIFERTYTKVNSLYSKGFSKSEKEALENIVQDERMTNRALVSKKYNEIIYLKDIIDYEMPPVLATKQIKRMVRYPIYFNHEIIGDITIYNPRQVGNLHIGYLSIYIGIAIKNFILNSYILDQLKKGIKDKQELEIFFSISKQIMLTIDKENHVKVMGNKCSELLGWNETEMSNLIKKDAEFMEYLESVRQDLQEESFISLDKKYSCKNGEIKEIRWIIKYKALENIMIIIGHDISKKKKEEEEELKLQVEMELEYIKGELLACMSNEFKTPTNTILYTIEILKGVTSDKEMQKYIGFIKQNAYRLIRLINNLVDSNSIEAGEYSLNLGYYNIVEIVKSILKSIEDYIYSKGVRLKVDMQVDEVRVNCDPEKIERIILNLISNAIKYTPIGGIIKVSISLNEEFCVIYVRDNGEGISKNRLGSIFDRFSQCEDGLTRKREGSGIGLSIVKSLVEMQNGIISVESELGLGTEFKIVLPITIGKIETKWQEDHKKKLNKVERWNIEFSDIYE